MLEEGLTQEQITELQENIEQVYFPLWLEWIENPDPETIRIVTEAAGNYYGVPRNSPICLSFAGFAAGFVKGLDLCDAMEKMAAEEEQDK